MKLKAFSYRFGAEVLSSPQFRQVKTEIIGILRATAVPPMTKPKLRTRGGKKMVFRTDQKLLNKILEQRFLAKDWEIHPSVTRDQVTQIKADFKKGRVQVEAQFGNMARWYTDVFKFQVSYSLGYVDVGVLIVPMQEFAETIDENVVYFERVIRELPYAKMSITLPIWVIGIKP